MKIAKSKLFPILGALGGLLVGLSSCGSTLTIPVNKPSDVHAALTAEESCTSGGGVPIKAKDPATGKDTYVGCWNNGTKVSGNDKVRVYRNVDGTVLIQFKDPSGSWGLEYSLRVATIEFSSPTKFPDFGREVTAYRSGDVDTMYPNGSYIVWGESRPVDVSGQIGNRDLVVAFANATVVSFRLIGVFATSTDAKAAAKLTTFFLRMGYVSPRILSDKWLPGHIPPELATHYTVEFTRRRNK